MVDTMALLLPFGRASRTPRTVEHPAAGLPADDEVLLDAPDDRLGPALVAAGRGAYEAAAELLAATRRTAQWEYRDGYALRLAAFAHSRPEWLEAWCAAAPHDPDALLVKAQLAVDRAWRSPARAELLREVSPLITAAARADDRDPVPWRIALDHARGSRAGHTYFGELWEAAVRRAPLHYGCHVAALRYLASSWQGSHRECFDFADRAAQDAPADSLLQALPTRAALACLTDGCGPGVPPERLQAAVDRAIGLSSRFPAADLWPAAIRNKLAYVLVRLGRWEDALEQLRLIGPYATSFPWGRFSDDPLGSFLDVRDEVRLRTAAATPRGARPGHPRSGRAGRVHSGDD
ncbi:hypothetical protein J7F01_25285 [Streptomyces sp. ISL-22]|uniref:DUF4034 domain-containing protein n=1 Tax=Streptomyces curacoi TaxID=146536 RepID=A0A117PLX0_9ACTN|nr:MULTISPECIES: hypothetical protein [Streptomyces]KUM82058.1 hypothetical protein AQI70_01750 [Streptomyces curacoi]MBT2422996.1 hypothetical protein [Streptomyces sp. ISL-24]MBT2435426.1 hypothetical protein [Streptomyces sp. ISL-22]